MKRTQRTVILALCAIFLGCAAAFAAAPATPAAPASAPGKPKAVAVEPIKDAGSVAKGEKLSQDFAIRNDGTATLEITDVRAACGCTVASYDKTIAPGKAGAVHVVVDTVTFKWRSGP